MPEPPKWIDIDETLVVFRFVKHATRDHEDFIENFESDEERGETPLPGEHPEYMQGRSAFDSLENAREAWAGVYAKIKERKKGKPFEMKVGDFIAAIELRPARDSRSMRRSMLTPVDICGLRATRLCLRQQQDRFMLRIGTRTRVEDNALYRG
jgi:hypothetical protein